MKPTLQIISRIIVQPKSIVFLGHMEIIEIETIGFYQEGFKITMTDDSRTEINTGKEIY